MVFSKAFALAAIFATLTAAAPVNQKRAVVYETVTEVDVTTIDTTITLYPGQPTPSPVVLTTEVAVTSTTPAPQPPASTPPAVAASPAPAPPADPKPSPVEAPAAPATTVVPTTTAAPPPPPAPTTTQAPPPPPAPPAPSTTTTAAPAPSPAPPSGGSSSSGGSGQSSSGAGTYYDTATSMSSPSFCDTANDGESTNVVALSVDIMTQALCGKTITISHGGKTSTGTVVDKCMGCAAGDVDMSRHMFGELASLDAGRIPITWSL